MYIVYLYVFVSISLSDNYNALHIVKRRFIYYYTVIILKVQLYVDVLIVFQTFCLFNFLCLRMQISIVVFCTSFYYYLFWFAFYRLFGDYTHPSSFSLVSRTHKITFEKFKNSVFVSFSRTRRITGSCKKPSKPHWTINVRPSMIRHWRYHYYWCRRSSVLNKKTKSTTQLLLV